MGARTAVAWIGTLALAFGLGWWVGSPATPDPEDTVAALQEALEEENPLARAQLMSRLLEGLNAENAEDVIEVIEAEPRIQGSDLDLLMYAWTRFDPEGAFDAARHSGQKLIRWEGTAAATYYWALDNPKAALYWVETIQDKAFREFLTEHMITGWVLSGDRDSAAAYIAKLPGGRLKQVQTGLIMGEYLKDGLEAAIGWAESLPEDTPRRYRHEVFQRVAKQVAARDPEAAARWITNHIGQEHAGNTLRLIANEWRRRDPESTFEWLVSLPDDPQRNRILFQIFGRWYDDDPGAARKWLEAETIEAAHDPAVDAFARRLSETSPKKALHWAGMIEDSTRREKSLIAVGQNWYRKNPDVARVWVADSDLSESARAAVLNPPAREVDGGEPENRDEFSEEP